MGPLVTTQPDLMASIILLVMKYLAPTVLLFPPAHTCGNQLTTVTKPEHTLGIPGQLVSQTTIAGIRILTNQKTPPTAALITP